MTPSDLARLDGSVADYKSSNTSSDFVIIADDFEEIADKVDYLRSLLGYKENIFYRVDIL